MKAFSALCFYASGAASLMAVLFSFAPSGGHITLISAVLAFGSMWLGFSLGEDSK